MVARVSHARGAVTAHAVQTPVEPQNVVCSGGAADQISGSALLLSAGELDRGLFGEQLVWDLLLFSFLSAQSGPVGGVTL